MDKELLLKIEKMLVKNENITEELESIQMNKDTIESLPTMDASEDDKEHGYVCEFKGIPIEIDETLSEYEIKFKFKSNLESKGLVKDPVIKAEICEYDYDNFLKESKVIQRSDGFYLMHDEEYLDYMNDEEVERFLELKNEL